MTYRNKTVLVARKDGRKHYIERAAHGWPTPPEEDGQPMPQGWYGGNMARKTALDAWKREGWVITREANPAYSPLAAAWPKGLFA